MEDERRREEQLRLLLRWQEVTGSGHRAWPVCPTRSQMKTARPVNVETALTGAQRYLGRKGGQGLDFLWPFGLRLLLLGKERSPLPKRIQNNNTYFGLVH